MNYIKRASNCPLMRGDDDYRETLSKALKKYFELMDDLDDVGRPANWDALKLKKGMIIDKSIISL